MAEKQTNSKDQLNQKGNSNNNNNNASSNVYSASISQASLNNLGTTTNVRASAANLQRSLSQNEDSTTYQLGTMYEEISNLIVEDEWHNIPSPVKLTIRGLVNFTKNIATILI